MTRRRRFLALVVAVTVALAVPLESGADGVDAQGWWYIARSSELPIATPVPPGVEDDDLYVAAGPTGATAIAAVRATIDPSATTVQLVLVARDATGEVVSGACRADDAWRPVQAGNWDERPNPDCSVAAAGTFSEERDRVTFDVTALVQDGVLDVVVVPGESEDGTPVNFTVTFESPGDGSITASSTSPPAGDSGSVPSPPSDGDSPPPTATGTAGPVGPVPRTTPFEPVGGLDPSPVPEAGIELPTTADEIAALPPTRPRAAAPAAPGDDPGRLIALGLAAALGAAFVFLRSRPGPAPAPILALAASQPTAGSTPKRFVVSGVGRFSRERSGRPPSLH